MNKLLAGAETEKGTGRLSQNGGMKSAYLRRTEEGRQCMAFKAYNQDQAFLLPLSLQDFVPERHLTRVINAVVGGLDFEPIISRYSDLGCTAYHPGMMVFPPQFDNSFKSRYLSTFIAGTNYARLNNGSIL